MSMPWDPVPPSRPQPPPQPYQPPPQPYRPPYQPPEQMQPDVPPVPVVARHPDTGEAVKVDIADSLQAAIQSALTEALTANKDQLQANAQNAITALVSGRKPVVEKEKKTTSDGHVEDAFSVGPHTIRTFFSGMAIDVGFAVVATLATVFSPNFNAMDTEAWLLVGAMVLKTGLSTAISYVLKLKVR